jgi:AcrR family transcriptional regulator
MATDTATATATPAQLRNRIIDALMELAGERAFEDITINDIARRAEITLAQFRDHFPSKGAVLAGFTKRIDRIVLEGTSDDLIGEPAKDRLFDVLMRRLDAMAPYKRGLEGIMDWVRRDPLSAAALNREVVNAMRFMLEAAEIDSDGTVGAIKLQGLALAWTRVLDVWLHDHDPDQSRTMAALDRELTRGGQIVARVEDLNRLATPLRSLARVALDVPRSLGERVRHRAERRDDDVEMT